MFPVTQHDALVHDHSLGGFRLFSPRDSNDVKVGAGGVCFRLVCYNLCKAVYNLVWYVVDNIKLIRRAGTCGMGLQASPRPPRPWRERRGRSPGRVWRRSWRWGVRCEEQEGGGEEGVGGRRREGKGCSLLGHPAPDTLVGSEVGGDGLVVPHGVGVRAVEGHGGGGAPGDSARYGVILPMVGHRGHTPPEPREGEGGGGGGWLG